MKRIVILGSTGSIGVNTLRVVENLKGQFKVVGLSTNANVELLEAQILKFRPEVVAVRDPSKALELRKRIGTKKKPEVLKGIDGLLQIAGLKDVDIVVVAISGGISCLLPLLEAIKAGKQIALANKEALVMAGHIIVKQAKSRGVSILPVDSEHSAIFQCLNTHDAGCLRRIYLTGTGGPLRKLTKSQMDSVSPAQAINHPKWKMGKKISVDSATLMNKGLEVMEARWLFGASIDKIEILIHPEAVIHSMVEFVDGSIIAQLGVADMRLPIQFALTYPDRLPSRLGSVDFSEVGKLTFHRPDLKKFPCLRLAYQAARAGGTAPCVLNAANEVLVDLYLKGNMKFTRIPRIVEKVLASHRVIENPSLKSIIDSDSWSREKARGLLGLKEKIKSTTEDTEG